MLKVFLAHSPEMFEGYYGEAALAALSGHAEVVRNPTTRSLAGDELARAAAGCQAIVADRSTPGQAATFAAAPDLVAFLRVAVDISTIDVPAASAHGILVTRATPGFTDAVAELAFGMIADLARGISDAVLAYRRGEEPTGRMGRPLAGATLGVIGYGRIGRRVAELGLAFRMRVLVHDPYARVEDPRIAQVPLDDLLAGSDFVLPLAAATPETENLMDAAAFARMKRGAHLVNLSRGNLVDEAALEAALDSGHLAGAAMDVGRAPDQRPSIRLARRPDAIATPHVGGLTPDAIRHQAFDTVRQVAALAQGRLPDNAVNAEQAHRLARLGIAP